MKKNLLAIALQEYGVRETSGSLHTPRILTYFRKMGKPWIKKEETAWCSAYVNFVALESEREFSGKLTARSWLRVGTPVETPEVGDVVVFWRERIDSWKGHVGFFIGYSADKKQVYCLGGNQNNSVCIAPYSSSRVLGFRRLGTLCTFLK